MNKIWKTWRKLWIFWSSFNQYAKGNLKKKPVDFYSISRTMLTEDMIIFWGFFFSQNIKILLRQTFIFKDLFVYENKWESCLSLYHSKCLSEVCQPSPNCFAEYLCIYAFHQNNLLFRLDFIDIVVFTHIAWVTEMYNSKQNACLHAKCSSE